MTTVLYSVEGHHAHGGDVDSGLVDDSSCLGSHRCRIYDISALLTDSRWLGASVLHLELVSADRESGLAFVAALRDAMSPHIAAKLTLEQPHLVRIEDVEIDLTTKIDPSRMLPLATKILCVEVEKPRNWRARTTKLPAASVAASSSAAIAASSSSDDSASPAASSPSHAVLATGEAFEAVAAAAASALPPLSALLTTPPCSSLGASLHCTLLRASGSTASGQLYLDKLSSAIAREVGHQKQLLMALQRETAAMTGAALASGAGDYEDQLLAAFLQAPAPNNKKAPVAATLVSRVRTHVLKHEAQRQALVAILRNVHRIKVLHTCNVCERILRIESDGGAAASSSSSSFSAVAAAVAAAAPLLSTSEVLARYAALSATVRACTGEAGKARRKKVNGKIRDLRAKYPHVDFTSVAFTDDASADA